MLAAEPPLARLASLAAPDNLIAKLLPSEYRVHQFLQVVVSCWIAVQIGARRRLHDTSHLKQPHSHEA